MFFRVNKALLCSDCTSNQLGSMLTLKNELQMRNLVEINHLNEIPPFNCLRLCMEREKKMCFSRDQVWGKSLDSDVTREEEQLCPSDSPPCRDHACNKGAFTYGDMQVTAFKVPAPHPIIVKSTIMLTRQQQWFWDVTVPISCSVEMGYTWIILSFKMTPHLSRSTGIRRSDVLQSLATLPKEFSSKGHYRSWYFPRHSSLDTLVWHDIFLRMSLGYRNILLGHTNGVLKANNWDTCWISSGCILLQHTLNVCCVWNCQLNNFCSPSYLLSGAALERFRSCCLSFRLSCLISSRSLASPSSVEVHLRLKIMYS